MRLLLALAAVAAAVILPATPAQAEVVCLPSQSVVITDMVFFPPAVDAGKSSTAHMRAHNCTNVPIHGFATWTARFINGPSDPAVPVGCPVIDPVVYPLVLPANGDANSAITYGTLATCTATRLHATVTVSASGLGTLATRSVDLVINH